MEKYTFICEFRGGTYISQFLAKSLIDAFSSWRKKLDPSFFSEKIIEKINVEMSNDIYIPNLITGLESVWCTSITLNRSFLLLNIVKTV